MNIEDAIGDLNKDLYSHIKTSYKEIKFEPSKENSWSCVVDKGVVNIKYAPTNWKEASLTHELLHAEVQLRGYKKINQLITRDNLDESQLELLKELIMACDNEFQHIKMFPIFHELKFNPKEFYCDADINSEDKLRKCLTTSPHNLMSLALQLLSVKAPGGNLSENAKNELLEIIRNFDNGKFKEKINELENVITKWHQIEEYDAEPFIKEYLAISGVDYVWVSYTFEVRNFNENGFFPSNSFTVEDYQKARV